MGFHSRSQQQRLQRTDLKETRRVPWKRRLQIKLEIRKLSEGWQHLQRRQHQHGSPVAELGFVASQARRAGAGGGGVAGQTDCQVHAENNQTLMMHAKNWWKFS